MRGIVTKEIGCISNRQSDGISPHHLRVVVSTFVPAVYRPRKLSQQFTLCQALNGAMVNVGGTLHTYKTHKTEKEETTHGSTVRFVWRPHQLLNPSRLQAGKPHPFLLRDLQGSEVYPPRTSIRPYARLIPMVTR